MGFANVKVKLCSASLPIDPDELDHNYLIVMVLG